jgi:hypothetical protein
MALRAELRTVKPCGPDAPTLASSPQHDRVEPNTGFEAKPLKPLRGGCRMFPVPPLPPL